MICTQREDSESLFLITIQVAASIVHGLNDTSADVGQVIEHVEKAMYHSRTG